MSEDKIKLKKNFLKSFFNSNNNSLNISKPKTKIFVGKNKIKDSTYRNYHEAQKSMTLRNFKSYIKDNIYNDSKKKSLSKSNLNKNENISLPPIKNNRNYLINSNNEINEELDKIDKTIKIKMYSNSQIKLLNYKNLNKKKTTRQKKNSFNSINLFKSESPKFTNQKLILKNNSLEKKIIQLNNSEKEKEENSQIKTLNLKNNNNNINNNNIIMNKTINNYSSIIYKFACRTKAGKDLSGQTKTNQDNFLAKNKIFNLLNYSAFAVFDGHGINGHTISKYIKEYFIDFFTSTKKLNIKNENITEEEIYNKLSDRNFFNKICEKSEEKLKKEKNINSNLSGTTGNFLIHIKDKIICYNIGDSRSLYITEDYKIIEISKDHKPEIEEESKRILEKGGRIKRLNNSNIGPFRVWLKNEDYPGLAMSRSFGDFIAETIGVICKADIFIFDIIQHKIKAVVMGSDGLFQFLNNEQISIICKYYIQKGDCVGCCKKLVEQAYKLWNQESTLCDDITCIVIFFKGKE